MCFDYINPKIAVECFRYLGMSEKTANVLEDMWTGQMRMLQYGEEVHPRLHPAGSSTPQGDPWAMMATAVVLAGPLLDLKQRFPSVTPTIYVDDRTWLADTADMCVRYGDAWKEWSAFLGLRENEDKAQYSHTTKQGLEFLEEALGTPQTVTLHPKILGNTFVIKLLFWKNKMSLVLSFFI